MIQANLVKLFVSFGDKWVKAEEFSDLEVIKRKKLKLIKWFLRRLKNE